MAKKEERRSDKKISKKLNSVWLKGKRLIQCVLKKEVLNAKTFSSIDVDALMLGILLRGVHKLDCRVFQYKPTIEILNPTQST